MESTTLYGKIYKKIKDDIESGILKSGDRIPTEYEIGEMFQVSRITVVRAMKELENLGLISRTKRKGSFVCDISDAQRKQVESKNCIIPVLLPFNEGFGYEVLKGAQEEADKNGHYITFYNTENHPVREREILKSLLENGICGLVVYPSDSYDNVDLFSKMLIEKRPLVFLDRTVCGIEVPYVTSNNYKGMYELVKHVIACGHKRIGYYCTWINRVTTEAERFKGFCQAMVEAGLEPKSDWIIENCNNAELDLIVGEDNRQGQLTELILDRIMSKKVTPTAIVCSNDILATNILKAAIKRGMEVPRELSVTGFDNLTFTEHLEVPLNTVHQSLREIGAISVKMLVDLMNGRELIQKKVVLDTKCIQRSSVAVIT